jgi:putative intracellular protease/amidase
MAPKILVVLTSVDKMPKTDNPTGWYLPEFAHPYEVLAPKADIVVASPKGGVAPVDPASVKMFEADKVAQDFLNNHKDVYSNTTPLREFLGRAGEFDALFYPGGHGPMFDLAVDKESIQLIQEFWAAGKVVSAVCHGPAAFVNVDVDGQRLVKGKQVTGFTNAEEDQVQLSSLMPFMLETELTKAGGDFVKADEPWGVKVVTDGKFITGQNPASGKAVGEAIAKALGI